MVLALLGSLLTAVYCFRVVYYLFFTGARMPDARIDEGPATMYIPAALLALGTVFFGIFSSLLIPSLSTAARVILAK